VVAEAEIASAARQRHFRAAGHAHPVAFIVIVKTLPRKVLPAMLAAGIGAALAAGPGRRP
jgi:hypothetical protein